MTTDTSRERDRLAEAMRVTEHLAQMLDRARQAMTTLLDGTGRIGWRSSWPGAPSESEEAADWAARALDNTAKRLLELHTSDDGPGPYRYAQACRRYAKALLVAASGRRPDNLDSIAAELHAAIAETVADARRVAKGVIRGHEIDMAALRAAGAGTLAGRIEHETRHQLAVLREIAQPRGDLF